MTDAEAPIASVAAYFRAGLTLGLIEAREVRDWAYRVIDRLPSPPAEIIDVALSREDKGLLAALNVVEAESSEAFGWTLVVVRLEEQRRLDGGCAASRRGTRHADFSGDRHGRVGLLRIRCCGRQHFAGSHESAWQRRIVP